MKVKSILTPSRARPHRLVSFISSVDASTRVKANVEMIFYIDEDDPHLEGFKTMKEHGVAQVRVVPATGAEKFAEFIFHKLNNFVKTETQERVRVAQVEFMEHNKNTAIYSE